MRLYREVKPALNDGVYVQTYEKTELGFYVHLLEYGINGFIPLSGMIRKKKSKSYAKLCNSFFAIVMNITEYSIDLNKLKARNMNKDQAYIKYSVACKLLKIGKMIYILLSKYNELKHLPNPELEDVMENSIWRLYDEYDINNQLYDTILNNISICFNTYYTEDAKQWILNIFKSRIKKTEYKIDKYFTVQTTAVDAISELKRILPETVEVIAPPIYKITTQNYNLEDAIKTLDEIYKSIDYNKTNTGINIIKKTNIDHLTQKQTNDDYLIVKYPVPSISIVNEHNIKNHNFL